MDDALIAFGSPVKFLDEAKTRIGGFLVRYSGPSDPDLYGDFFTAKTDFGHDDLDGLKLRLYYEHGYDGHFKSTAIGRGTVKAEDAGLWFEAQLAVADEYADMVRGLIEEGKLGYSSGAVGHLVDREEMGKAAWIKSWPLGEASLTPRPAEPRNVVSLKSLVGDQEPPTWTITSTERTGSWTFKFENAHGEAEASSEDSPEAPPVKGAAESTADAEPAETPTTTADTTPVMEEKNEAKAAEQPKANPADDAIKRLEARIEAMQKEYEESKTVTKNTVVDVPAIRPNGIKKDTEKAAFAHWVRSGDTGAVKGMIVGEESGNPLVEIKASNATDMNIGTAADGGNTVTDDMYGAIMEKAAEQSLWNQLGVFRLTGNGTTIDVPYESTTTANGLMVTAAEANDFDEDAPSILQRQFTLVKKTKYTDISYELLQDSAVNIEEYLARYVARKVARTHNDLLIAESVANGTELKATASTTAAVIGELEALPYHTSVAYYLNESPGAWVMKAPTYGSVISIVSSNNRLYAENPQGSTNGPGLLGYPVKFSEEVDAYGTANNRFAHFGAWGSYMGLYESPSLQFLRDPFTVGIKGQVRLLWYHRLDYGVLQSDAGGFIRHITT